MNYLNLAMNAHQKNQIDLAKQNYLKHLEIAPTDFNANQLLGAIYFQENEFLKAKQFIEVSLKYNKNQPQVWMNLVAVNTKLGNDEGIISSYENLIKITPDNVNVYVNLAKFYRLRSHYLLAQNVLNECSARFNQNKVVAKEQGQLFKSQNRFDLLVEYFESHIDEYTDDVNIIFDYALALRVVGKPQLALRYYKQLETLGMRNYQLSHNMANALSDTGEIDKAIKYYSEAISHNMLYVESHRNLNELLWEKGRIKEFLSSYTMALSHHPDAFGLSLSYVAFLNRTGNYSHAESHLKSINILNTEEAEYYLQLGEAINNQGRKDEAIKTFEDGLVYGSANSNYVNTFTKCLIEVNKISQATIILENYLLNSPDDQMAIAYLGVCYKLSGNTEEKLFNNYQEMVQEFEIDLPSQYQSIEYYCDDLKDLLYKLHTAEVQPLEQTLHQGTQTRGNLFNYKSELLTHLQRQIHSCVKRYSEGLPKNVGKFGIRACQNYDFSGSWSVKLKQQGYHSMHVHPMGWLSAVFYVELPKVMDDSIHEGWLKFGEPNLKLANQLESSHYVKPMLGKLVLFPSYMWHGTVAFESSDYRTTIAFDLKLK